MYTSIVWLYIHRNSKFGNISVDIQNALHNISMNLMHCDNKQINAKLIIQIHDQFSLEIIVHLRPRNPFVLICKLLHNSSVYLDPVIT